MSERTPALIAPKLVSLDLKLHMLEKLVSDDAAATAKTIGTPYAAILIGFTAVLANLLAQINRTAAADFFHAIWCVLKSDVQGGELAAKRVELTAATLFQHGWRRAK